jgi:hypothetical protein
VRYDFAGATCRMTHRLLNFLMVLSLLLCVAVVVLWVRSYCEVDTFVTARHAGV